MTDKPAIRARAEQLFAQFQAAGAQAVDADILLPAGRLLDLYGEDIRARAYVTHDPDQGEMMLRPDFTLPVVERHMAQGGNPARYTYMGEVFRKQQSAQARAREYLQVGFELFDADTPARADAEVFALFHGLLAPLGLRPVTGDIGILMAAISGLRTTERRRAALARHVWRPQRFRRLADRFAGRLPMQEGRKALLDALKTQDAETLLSQAGPITGLRERDEILARIAHLVEDDQAPPLASAEADALDALLAIAAPLTTAYRQLQALAGDLIGLKPAIAQFATRIDALQKAGLAVETLPFEAAYGRMHMEYYDGFVFGFLAPDRTDLPPISTGGRYDALTRILGQGRGLRAVGGVIRPELLIKIGQIDAQGTRP